MGPEQRETGGDPATIWKRIAPWWDEAIGEGNEFQLRLVMPATDRLLNIRPGERVLDVACGNGNYARRLAKGGARVLGVDVAPGFIEAAARRTPHGAQGIKYQQADATDPAALQRLAATGHFDAVVCSMALMDLPVIEPLAEALPTLLRPGGRFVFSIPHPCFNSAFVQMTARLVNQDGELRQLYGVEITRYLTPAADRSAGILNQPEPHYLYHRPISLLVQTFLRQGLVLEAIDEPAFGPGGAGGKNAFSWKARGDIPPVMLFRFGRP